MEWIEVTGRTLEEAVERALDSLGVHETELDYQVLTEPKSGLLGLRRTEARIRARVKPRSREKPNDKRRRQRDEQRARRRSTRERPAENADPAQAGTRGGASGNGQDRQPQARAGNGDGSGGSGSRSRRRRRRSSGSGGARTAPTTTTTTEPAAERAVGVRDDEESNDMERTGSVEEQVQAGHEFATGLLEAFEAQGTVAVEPEDNEIEVRIEGDNLGLLVGPKGATLAALEELLRGAVGHRGPGRMHLDVAGYRAKRRAALADFARRVAQDVRENNAAKALEPMSAPDRKVVHDTVAEIEGVATISDGEEPRRRVIIQPA